MISLEQRGYTSRKRTVRVPFVMREAILKVAVGVPIPFGFGQIAYQDQYMMRIGSLKM